MEKHDIQITCIDCSSMFAWTVDQQNFLEDLIGKPNENALLGPVGEVLVKKPMPPKRCKPCREKRKILFTKN